MTEDERKLLLHTVMVMTLLLERLGQLDLLRQYNENAGPHAKRVVDAQRSTGESA